MELIRRAALSGIVVGVVGVIVLFLANPFSGTPTPSMDENFTPVAPVLIPAEGLASGHGLGAEDAPVVLTVWTDYQCPICGTWGNGVEPTLYERYITDGELRIEHRHYSFLGEESFTAAVGAECAADQGKFWAFHSYLYSNQNSENQGAFSAGRLRKIAEASGQDLAAWDTCIADPAVRAEVEADAEEAKSLGITGTPTLISTRKLVSCRGRTALARLHPQSALRSLSICFRFVSSEFLQSVGRHLDRLAAAPKLKRRHGQALAQSLLPRSALWGQHFSLLQLFFTRALAAKTCSLSGSLRHLLVQRLRLA